VLAGSYRDREAELDSSKLLLFSVVAASFKIPVRDVTLGAVVDVGEETVGVDLAGVVVVAGFTFGVSSSVSDSSSLDSSSLDDSDSSFLGGETALVEDWRNLD
jgi:hypothetical protein